MMFFQKKIEKMGLRSQKVFVLPTSKGYLFFISLSIIFFMGLVYGNNMCFLISFLMLGQFIAALFISHKNVQKVIIKDFTIISNFVGKNLSVSISLEDPKCIAKECFLHFKETSFFLDELKMGINQSTTRFLNRGKRRYEHLILYSTHPFGLFKTWRYFNLAGDFYIYPELIHLSDRRSLQSGLATHGPLLKDSDFKEYKKFEKGQSMQRIDWKKFAMKDELYIKKFYEYEDERLILNLEQIELPLEEKLKYATTLIFEAQRQGTYWKLLSYQHKFESSQKYQDALEYLSIYQGGGNE